MRAARIQHGRFVSHRSEVERLESGLGDVPLASLPFLFAADFHLDEVETLSDALEEQLG